MIIYLTVIYITFFVVAFILDFYAFKANRDNRNGYVRSLSHKLCFIILICNLILGLYLFSLLLRCFITTVTESQITLYSLLLTSLFFGLSAYFMRLKHFNKIGNKKD